MDRPPGEAARAGEEPLQQALRSIPLLADLAEAEIGWLAEHAEELHLADGEVISREGEPADRMSIILAGEMMGRRERGGEPSRVFVARAGEITGLLPFSRMRTWASNVRAVGPNRLAVVQKDLFGDMLAAI